MTPPSSPADDTVREPTIGTDTSLGLPRRLKTAIRRHWGLLAVLLAATVFCVLVSAVLTLRYLAFDTAAWDLGNYNQAFSTTVTAHGFFYYTADLPSGNGGHLLATHASLILLVLLPIYAAAPAPPTLLVLQTVGVALAAVPFYFLARKEIASERWAVFFAVLFLANPVVLGVLWYDFHPEAFLPLGVLSAILFYRLRRWRLFLGCWFLTLIVIETAAPLLIAFVVLALLGDYFSNRTSWRTAWKRVPLAVWVALAAAILWLCLTATALPGALGANGAYSASYGINFSVLGAKSILEVIPTAVLHPSQAVAALSFGAKGKVLYVVLFLVSFGCLPLLGRMRYFIPGLVWILLALLSNNSGYYAFGDQYAAYALPFWAASAVSGFGRLRDWVAARSATTPEGTASEPTPSERARKWRRLRWVTGSPAQKGATVGTVLLLAGLGTSLYFISPLNSHPVNSLDIPYGIPTVTSHDELLHQMIGMIPASAGVLTSHFLFPEVSNRPNAYVLPVSSYFAGNLTFTQALDSYVNESDYVLYDIVSDPYSASLMEKLVNFSGFGVRAESDRAVLYERGWTQAPSLWSPLALNLTGGSLAVSPSYASGPVGAYSNVLRYSGGSPNGTRLWEGPVYQLPPGTYRMSLTYRVEGAVSGPTLRIEVGARPALISIVPIDVTASGHDYSITVTPASSAVPVVQTNVSVSPGSQAVNATFNLEWPAPAFLDLSGIVLSPSVSVDLYSVTVTQLSP